MIKVEDPGIISLEDFGWVVLKNHEPVYIYSLKFLRFHKFLCGDTYNTSLEE